MKAKQITSVRQGIFLNHNATVLAVRGGIFLNHNATVLAARRGAKHRVAVIAVALAALVPAAPAMADPPPLRNAEAVVFQPDRSQSSSGVASYPDHRADSLSAAHQGAVDGWISRIRSTRPAASYPEHQASVLSSSAPATAYRAPDDFDWSDGAVGAASGVALLLGAAAALAAAYTRRSALS